MQGKGSEDLFAAFLWKLIVPLHLGNLWRCIIDIPVVILSYHFVFYMLSNRAPALLSEIDLLLHICNQRECLNPKLLFSYHAISWLFHFSFKPLHFLNNPKLVWNGKWKQKFLKNPELVWDGKKKKHQFFKQSRACMRFIEMGSNFLHFIQAWIVKELFHFWKKWDLISSISFKLGLLKNLKVQFWLKWIWFLPFLTVLDC